MTITTGLIGVELRAVVTAADADGLDAEIPLAVSRREAAAAAATGLEEDTAADGRAVARAAGADVLRPASGVAVWEEFELWAAPVAAEPPVSADADPIPELRATPMPSATANPPTRPMHVEALIHSSIRDGRALQGRFHPT